MLIGLSVSYFWNSVLNFFGVLLLAIEIYGLEALIHSRIENNIIGIAVTLIIFFIFYKLSGIYRKLDIGG